MKAIGRMANNTAKENSPILKANRESEYGRTGNVRSGYRVLLKRFSK